MKFNLAKLTLFTQKIDRRHVQFIFLLLALVLLVVGAGAPEDGGSTFK